MSSTFKWNFWETYSTLVLYCMSSKFDCSSSRRKRGVSRFPCLEPAIYFKTKIKWNSIENEIASLSSGKQSMTEIEVLNGYTLSIGFV